MAYLAGAFMALWTLITVYVFYISRRQARLERELTSLEENLNQKS